jgi:hypothetical protein
MSTNSPLEPGPQPFPLESEGSAPEPQAEGAAISTKSAAEKTRKLHATRGQDGKFVATKRPEPESSVSAEELKALAIADRKQNFAFIRKLRDNPRAPLALRFKASELLAMHSDGKVSAAERAPAGSSESPRGSSSAPAVGAPLSPQQAYRLMLDGDLPPDPALVASLPAALALPTPSAAANAPREEPKAAADENAAPATPDNVSCASTPAEKLEVVAPEATAEQPPVDPEVQHVLATLSCSDPNDPRQVEELRRRAVGVVQKRRETAALLEREHEQMRAQQQLKAQREREAGLQE